MSLSALPHIYVINLKRSPERRETMTRQLEALNLSHTFVEGIDGKEKDFRDHPFYDRQTRLRWYGRDLLSTEVACLLSHRAVYQKVQDEGKEYGLLLEDDVVMAPDFPEALEAVMKLPMPWDMIRFLDDPKTQKRSRPIAPVYGDYLLSRLLSTPGGGHAYIFNRKAAKRLLELTEKAWQPIDVLYGYTWRTGLETYAVIPAPVWQNKKLDSLIGDVRFDKTVTLSGWRKALFPLSRAGFRFYEMVAKRFSSLKTWSKDRALSRRLRKV